MLTTTASDHNRDNDRPIITATNEYYNLVDATMNCLLLLALTESLSDELKSALMTRQANWRIDKLAITHKPMKWLQNIYKVTIYEQPCKIIIFKDKQTH